MCFFKCSKIIADVKKNYLTTGENRKMYGVPDLIKENCCFFIYLNSLY